MDISKLPKLSKTAVPAENPTEQPNLSPAPDQRPPTMPAGASGNIGPEIWFNAVVGLLLLFWGRQFGVYIFDRFMGREFHTGFFTYWNSDQDHGPEISYPQLAGHAMLTDGGLFLFGAIVLLEAAVKALAGLGYRVPVGIAHAVLGLAIVSTVFNLFVCYKFISDGVTPIFSGLAAAFGGFIIADIRRMSMSSRPAKFSTP
jgi:hypothetical protein